MTNKITGSILVCAGATLFTAGALLFNDASPPTAASATPSIGASRASSSGIAIANFTFSSATVAPGAVVVVTNNDGETHTVTAKQRAFDSRPIGGGKRGSITAPTARGTYAFVCTIHPSMKGQLVVA
jgi:plastocyanin